MKIHILGIAGTMTTPLALALKKAGHQITGSDQAHIYPPFSTTLRHSGIPLNTDYHHLKPDLVIVGSSFDKFLNTKNEFIYWQKEGVKYISATQYLAQNLIRPQSILVAGSFGKTTISALISWVLIKNKLSPAYFFGGQAINRFPSLAFSDSPWSVVEADESINGLDTQAKFLYYPVKYLILTSADWEHRDSYQTDEENLLAFSTLIKQVPKDGFIIYNAQSDRLSSLIKLASCPCFPYTTVPATAHLFGPGNQNNLAAVTTLCRQLNLKTASVAHFKGIKRRLQLISDNNHILFYDDFAQSPHRISQSLISLADKYPGRRLVVLFEPHASFLQYKESLNNLGSSFSPADRIFLAKISYTANPSKLNRTDLNDYKAALGAKLTYLPLWSDLIIQISSYLKPGDILVHFSSGGLRGLTSFRKIIKLCHATSSMAEKS